MGFATHSTMAEFTCSVKKLCLSGTGFRWPINFDKTNAKPCFLPRSDKMFSAVSRFDAGEGLSDLFEYRVEAVSSEAGLNFDDAIGRHCWVTFKGAGGNNRVFDGLLVEAQWLGLKDPVNHAYRLVLKPWLWMLSRTTDCRIFANRSVPDIVREIFDDNGFSDYRLALHTGYPTLEYCVQYRETDLAFVSRLMEEYGIYYFFEHEAGKHTMMLVDAKASRAINPRISSARRCPAHREPDDQRGSYLPAHRAAAAADRQGGADRLRLPKPNTNFSAKADGQGRSRARRHGTFRLSRPLH